MQRLLHFATKTQQSSGGYCNSVSLSVCVYIYMYIHMYGCMHTQYSQEQAELRRSSRWLVSEFFAEASGAVERVITQ